MSLDRRLRAMRFPLEQVAPDRVVITESDEREVGYQKWITDLADERTELREALERLVAVAAEEFEATEFAEAVAQARAALTHSTRSDD